MNRLTKLVDNGIITIYSYDDNGNMTYKAQGNGITTQYERNNAGMLTNTKTTDAYGHSTYSNSFYYLNGLMYCEAIPYGENNMTLQKSFSYDDMGRLKYEIASHNGECPYLYLYEYDLRGNRTKKHIDADYSETFGDIYYTYDLNNKLISEEAEIDGGEDTTARYYYDNNGNLTARQGVSRTGGMTLSGRSENSGMEIYRYDAFNRMSRYYSGSSEASYAYNTDNLRTSKTVNRETTDFIWNGQNLAAEINGYNMNTYTYDNTGIHMTDKDGTVISYIKDYHGSIVGTANSSGKFLQ